jgi:hypothetical protein
MTQPRGTRLALQLTRFAGRTVGLLIFAALAVLEPLVRFVLITLATLGMFVTIIFGFLIAADGFPRWTMLGMSVGCFLLLGAHYGAMSIFGNLDPTHDRR